MASGGDSLAGLVDTGGADGCNGGERDRCRDVIRGRGSDIVDFCDGGVNSGSGVTCGIDGAGGAGGNDGITGGARGSGSVSGGTGGSDGVAGGMAVEGWTRGSLSIRGANGNAGGMLLGGCFMEGVASGRCCTGGALVIRRGSGAPGGIGGGGRPVEGAAISSSGSCIDSSAGTR